MHTGQHEICAEKAARFSVASQMRPVEIQAGLAFASS
jgi:hypothetical protein